MGQPPTKHESSPLATFITLILIASTIASLLLMISRLTAVPQSEKVIRANWNTEQSKKQSSCHMDRIIFEGKLAKQIHDLNFVAILEKDAMDRLYAEGHTTPITNGTFAEKMAVNLFIPHPARFQGVEEFFTSTGRNETYANFLFLSRPMKIDGKIWFVMDNGPTSKNITIAGCHFDDKSCHQMDMEFAKNDLIIHESYTTSLQSVSFTRVFYMPSEALAHHLVFADKPKRTQ